MKKISALVLVFALVTVFNCDDEPFEGELTTSTDEETEITCETVAQNLETASINFSALEPADADYANVCSDYADVIQDMIDVCGDDNGALQLLLDSLGCR